MVCFIRNSSGFPPVNDEVFVPKAACTREIVVKRSRFIGTAERVESTDGVKAVLERRREDYSDASHVVYAFVIGEEKSEQCGMSDDGEPKGTAGRPVLEILKGSGIRDILLTVVRYFGGTKLGTGGLHRAYADCAREVCGALSLARKTTLKNFSMIVPYPLHDQVLRVLKDAGAEDINEDFGVKVKVAGKIPLKYKEDAAEKIRDLSGGSLDIES